MTMVVITMSLINSLNQFDLIYVMTQGGPYRSSETLAVTMYRESFTMFHMGYGAAVAIVLSLIVILLSGSYLRSNLKQEGAH
jgi:multiple sugar transport system permease protein